MMEHKATKEASKYEKRSTVRFLDFQILDYEPQFLHWTILTGHVTISKYFASEMAKLASTIERDI